MVPQEHEHHEILKVHKISLSYNKSYNKLYQLTKSRYTGCNLSFLTVMLNTDHDCVGISSRLRGISSPYNLSVETFVVRNLFCGWKLTAEIFELSQMAVAVIFYENEFFSDIKSSQATNRFLKIPK